MEVVVPVGPYDYTLEISADQLTRRGPGDLITAMVTRVLIGTEGDEDGSS